MESETHFLLFGVEVCGELHLQDQDHSVVLLLVNKLLVFSTRRNHCLDCSGGGVSLRLGYRDAVLVNLLGVHIDGLGRHLHIHDDGVFTSFHLFLCKFRERDFGSTVVRVANHQKQVDEGAGWLELANSVDGDLGDDNVHQGVGGGLVTRSHNPFGALLTLFDSLRLQLEAEGVELTAGAWLSVYVFQSLVQLGHLVDVEGLL